MKSYRRIWIQANGPIPKDEKGRSYEIHHINGNRADNRLQNLQCIPIEEHYKIHLQQGDYGAAFRIAQRLDIPADIKSELMRKSNKLRLEKGTHSFLRDDVRKKSQATIVDNIKQGKHGLQNKATQDKAIQAKRGKFTHADLSEHVKTGWESWKRQNGDPKQRTLQGSKAGAEKTKGTKWYHKADGTHLRTTVDDPRIAAEGWIPGRFNGKELSKNANYYKLNKKQ
jgi:hypothetical protein